MLTEFRNGFQPLIHHHVHAGGQMHSVPSVDLYAFKAVAMVLAGGIFAGAVIHARFPGGFDLIQEGVLQSMTAFAVTTEEGFHGLDLGFVKINLHSNSSGVSGVDGRIRGPERCF
jgi:hypothetical protein